MSVYYIERIFCQMRTRYQNKIIIIFALSVSQYKPPIPQNTFRKKYSLYPITITQNRYYHITI